jgi:hypothetical protein
MMLVVDRKNDGWARYEKAGTNEAGEWMDRKCRFLSGLR